MMSIVLIPTGKIALGKLAQALAYGARTLQVDGNFDDCLKIVREVTDNYPIELLNSLNPMRMEGQKTLAFEVCDVLGEPPDYHLLPVGNAGNITAHWWGYKAYKDAGKIDRVIAIGPAVMMKFCSLTTKPFNVPTIVSMNSIMVDGTGMCGCCRISVGGLTKFACVDGPDFDGHQVDWNIAFDRQKVYLKEEKDSLDKWESCQCGKS